MYKKLLTAGALSFSLLSPVGMAMDATFAKNGVTVNGAGDDAVWQEAQWHPLEHLMVGSMPSKEDFSGRFKLAWDEGKLYLLVEIVDDILIDTHPDPKDKYWDDDCLEVFIDEDASGGNHQYSYNAFAYHIALDGNAADFGDENDGNGVVLLNDHVESEWHRDESSPYTITWEVAIDIYDDSFSTAKPGEPLSLKEGKIMGFMLAYCDNDGSPEREHFVGSHEITPVNGDKNLGFIDASVFGKITLVT